jgi:hypothetical protein
MPELLRPAGDQMFDTRAWRGRAVVGGDGIESPAANANVSAAHQCTRAGRDVRYSVATAYWMRYCFTATQYRSR